MEKEKKQLNILAVQMHSEIADKKANLEKIKKLINENVTEKTDVIILPEVFNIGWYCPAFRENAEDLLSGETFNTLSELAKLHKKYIIGGSFITKENDKYYNTCPVISPNGKLIDKYNKMHLFSYYGCNEGSYVTRGINPLIITIKDVQIGLSICYDIRFPEIYRAYAKQGVDVLINMAAWPLNRAIHWDSLTKARAIENQVYFVALTQTGKLNDGEYNLGHSKIISYTGEIITDIVEKEGAISATLTFDDMYEFRNKCTVLKDIQNCYSVREK